MGFITEFLVSKLVQSVQFSLFYFNYFWSYFFFDPFLVPGDCAVTKRGQILKFLIFGLHHCIPRVKISASVKFQLFISIICEVICFWPFFWSRGIVTSLTGSNFEFLMFGLHHWIPRVKICASVKFQLFISIICEVILLLTLFWSRGIVTSLTGSNFEIFDIWASSLKNSSCQN